jgi:ATP-dependent RNA helicase DeaD
VLLDGADVIAQAQTGSGKTAAFGFPIIEQIDPRNRKVQALILCPTRELAIQVAEALHKYGRHKDVETLPIYGGQPYERQFRGLQRGPQIVVGTPGRVMDHMRRNTLHLEEVKFFILDEADEMLDMGFVEDIEWILEQVPKERQTALFSATMPARIVQLASKYMKDPVRLSVVGKEMTVPETHQSFYEVPRSRKVDALTRILDAETPTSAMIFCRTKHGVDELGEALMARGYPVETIHGDLSQTQRDRVMRRFRSGQADILIATDVAARGLDIPDVSHVINYDVPESAEAYVHRIGRTGRAGKTGSAVTLITPRETRWLRQIERTIKAQIEARRLPSMADVAERRREAMKSQILDAMKNEEAYTPYMATVDELASDYDVAEVAAAILKLYADETGRGSSDEMKEDDVATFSSAGGSRGESGMTRLFLSIGRNQSVRPQDIVGAIANEANIPGRSIGAIDILDAYSFVDIPSDFAERVILAIKDSGIKGRPVNAEVAQPGAGRPSREERGGGGGGYRGGGGRRDDRGGARPGGDRGGSRSGGFSRRDGGGQRGPATFRVRRDDGGSGNRPPRGE